VSATEGQTLTPRVLPGTAERAARSGAVELVRARGPAVAGYALPFALVAYLALAGGGYDPVVRGEIGIAAWWIVLLGAAVGVLPATRVPSPAWIVLGLLAAFGLWAGLGVMWSDSSERAVLEATRIATLLGVLALAIAAQGRDGLRRTVCGVAAAIAVVAVLALLSRLHPQWFAESEVSTAFGGDRLSGPLDYWNGLAALLAIGLPLLTWIAAEARTLVARAAAAAAIPALVLAGYYTLSRGGAAEAAVAIGVLVALHPRRLTLLPTLILAIAGGAILVAAAGQRPELADGLTTPAALAQGDEMLTMAIVVGAGTALVQVAIGVAARHRLGPRLRVSRRAGRAALAGAAATALLAAIAIDLPGVAADRWEEFKVVDGSPGDDASRFESAAGNSRYQYWQAAVDAGGSRPLVGVGPGTFEFVWAREREIPGFVRDAHSLYVETLAELGVAGLMTICALIGFVLATGARRALRRGADERRTLLAAATAAGAAFALAAAIDWAWELTVLPVAFLLLAAAIVGPSAESRRRRTSRFERRPLAAPARAAVGLAAAAAIVAIAIPMASTSLVRESQAAVGAGDLDAALVDARSAVRAQPYAAGPRLQEALVLELRGELEPALAAARAATDAERVNWRTWLVRSRLAARNGNAAESVRAYRRARSLNPASRLFR